jgi:energy-converting hydrogenase Eha subunit E
VNRAAVEPALRGRGRVPPPAVGTRRAGWRHALGLVAGTTLVVWFFSEVFFVNVGDFFYGWSRRDGVAQVLLDTAEAVGVWLLFYAFFVLWLLAAVEFFRVRNAWALAFAAAICGWAIEGSAIPIMYQEMPIALLWPAASWHVLVNVFVGWWLLRWVIETQPVAVVAGVFAALGGVWSLWATWFWPVGGGGSLAERDLPLPPSDFAFVALIGGLLLTAGYTFLDRFGWGAPPPMPRALVAFVAVGALLTVLGSQFHAAIFFALVGVAGVFLWRNRSDETRPSLLATFRGRSPAANLVAVMAMPAVAAALYPVWYGHGVSVNVHLDLVVGLINLAALALFAVAGYRVWARRSAGPGRGTPRRPRALARDRASGPR